MATEAKKPNPDLSIPPQATGLLSLPVLGSAMTPLTLALTGMLYLTGWTERNRLLKEFGVSASIVPEPIQNTLARGYTPLLVGIAVSVAFLAAFLFAMNRTFRRVENAFAAVPILSSGMNLGEVFRRARVRFIYVVISICAFLLALLISHVSGIASARIKADSAKQAVAGDCRACFKYRVDGRDLTGKVLAQSDARTVLLVTGGVVLIKTEDISAVRK